MGSQMNDELLQKITDSGKVTKSAHPGPHLL